MMPVAQAPVRSTLFTLAAAVILSACAAFTSPPPEGPRGMLTEITIDLPQRKSPDIASATLLIVRPQTQRAYDTTQMAYRLRDQEIAYYRDHEWAATPAEMMQPLIESTLLRTNRFAAVLASPNIGRVTYVLQTQIRELVQDFSPPAAAVRLSLLLQLTHNASGRAASKEVVVTEPMSQRSPDAGIAAANRATANALREVAQFVLDNAMD
jgi:cholesterol transport system auxiliary component